MAPLALLLAAALCPSPSRAENARVQAADAALVPAAGEEGAVKEGASRPFDGGTASETTVTGRDASGAARLAKSSPAERKPTTEPPASGRSESPGASKLGTGLLMAGAAALGALQGGLAAGVVGAVAGGVLGLGAAWLFHKGDYGGAFGVTAGAIVGTAFGGPIGGIIGAVVGGLIGHFLGKLFL